MSEEQVRIGVIGAGGIAAVHATAIEEAGNVVAGTCDVHRERAEALAAGHPGAVVFDDVETLLGDESIPAVVVALPNCLHSPIAIQALKAGKDVLLEKPMATSIEECDAVLKAMGDAPGLVQLGFVCRHAATTISAMEAIDTDRLGLIYRADATMYRRRGIPGLGGWFTTRSMSGGGVLIDLGPHLVDLLLHLCGRPRVLSVDCSITSHFGHPPSGYRFTDMWAGPPVVDGPFDVEDGATALLRCEGGLDMTLNMCWASHLPEKVLPDGVTLFGVKGAMHFDIWGEGLIVGTELDDASVDINRPIKEGENWNTAFRRQHETFSHNVRTRTAPTSTAEQGREVQRVLDALYRSNEAGASVDVAG